MRYYVTYFYASGADYTPFMQPCPDGIGQEPADLDAEGAEAAFAEAKAKYEAMEWKPSTMLMADGTYSEFTFNPGTPTRVALFSSRRDPGPTEVVVFDYVSGKRL